MDIEGSVNVKASDIASRLRTRIGAMLTRDTLRDDLKSIWEMNAFDDVQVEANPVAGGYAITFLVRERVKVREVKFRNAKEFPEKDLKEKIGISAGDYYDPARGHEAENIIAQGYREKGYPDATVGTEIEPVEKERGRVDLIFVVAEGIKFHVRKIMFEGNKVFPEGALKKPLKNKEAMFFFQSGLYMKDEVARDGQRIVEFYKNEGYQKARVVKHEVLSTPKKDKDAVDLKFTIIEGGMYTVKSVTFQGDNLLTDRDRARFEMKKGDKLSQRRVDEGIAGLREIYTERGYIYAAILPDMVFDDARGEADLILRFHEGTVAYIDRILVRGNEETKEKVITRELVVRPGQMFDSSKIRKSQERIYNLGFFEDVKVYTEPSLESGKENLVFEVKERQTGTISLGGGYSSQFGFVGFLQLTKANLFGLGIKIGAEWEIGQKRRNLSLDYLDPYFWDTPVSLGLGYWDTDRDLPNTFTQKSMGGSIELGYRPHEDWRVVLGYKYEIDDVDPLGSIPLPSGVSDEPLVTSSPSLRVTWDTRDNIFDPMAFGYGMLYGQVAGGPIPEAEMNFIGGDTKFYKFIADGSYFIPTTWVIPWKRFLWLLPMPSLGLHSRAGRAWGAGGEDVPIFERFFLGGTDSIRGYGERVIGPEDPVTERPSGGRAMFQFNAELKWPIFRRILTLAAPFYDAGNAWDYFAPFSVNKFEHEFGHLAESVGLGVRLTIPNTIIVVRVDYGWGISREYDPVGSGRLHFNIGNIF